MDTTPPSSEDRLEIPRLHSSRRRLVVVSVAALLVTGGLAAYFLSRKPEANPYRTTRITRTSIVKEILATGHLHLTGQVEVPAPIEGQLVEVLVRTGDDVEEGQALAQLDTTSAQIAFDVARAEVEAADAKIAEAEAAVRRAGQMLQRTERLAQKNLASDRQLEDARSESAKAKAALRAARAERSASENRAALRGRERSQTAIVATRKGLVLEAPDRTGMIVGPHTRLFRIGAPLETMHVVAPVGEADIGEVVLGQTAGFEVPTYPGKSFEAQVEHINPDPKTQYGAVFYDVTLRTENPDRLLLPGMTAQVRIRVAKTDDALAVREAALRFTPEGAPPAPARSRLWRVKGQQLEELAVEPGLSDGAMTEVRPVGGQSLDADDTIALGLAATGNDEGAAPSLSLRGDQR